MNLCSQCQFVRGAKRAAIYDLESGRVYSINEIGKEVIEGTRKHKVFWQELEKMGLATDGVGEKKKDFSSLGQSRQLRFMWLELTEFCNLRCLHCYGRFGGALTLSSLQVSTWKRVIEEGKELGCEKIQLTGGEVTAYPHMFEIASFARDIGYDFVEIFTNGTLLAEEDIRRIKDMGLHVAVSFYSNKDEVHDKITQVPGSHSRTIKTIKALVKNEVPSRIAVIVMRQNQSTIEQTRELIKRWGLWENNIDVVRPTGRGDDVELEPSEEVIRKWGSIQRPNFHTSREAFLRSVSGNSCWSGKIVVTNKGEVLPCPFARTRVVGKVRDKSLKEVVYRARLQKLWNLSKDQIRVCQDCEYRYACKDCRPLAEASSGSLTSKYPYCTYDPYEGMWQEKGVR